MTLSAKDVTKQITKRSRPKNGEDYEGTPSYLEDTPFLSYAAEIGRMILRAKQPMTIADIGRAMGKRNRPRWNQDAVDSLTGALIIEGFQYGARQGYRRQDRARVKEAADWRFIYRKTDRSRPVDPENQRKVTA